MKSIFKSITFLSAALVLIYACNRKEQYLLPEDSVFESNGLKPSNIFIYVQSDTILRNIFSYAEKVNIEFSDIEGFNKEDGLVYPGMSVTIAQGEDTLIHKPDVYPELDHGTDYVGLDLINYFRCIFPYRTDNAFNVNIKVWDKKGTNNFFFSMPFYIQANPLIQLTNEGIEYKSVYFFDHIAQESKNTNVFQQESFIYLHCEDLTGFKSVDGRIYPGMQMRIADSLGHELMNDANIFSEFSELGITPNELDSIFPLELWIGDGLASPTAFLHARLFDLKSDSFLDIQTRIHIVQTIPPEMPTGEIGTPP